MHYVIRSAKFMGFSELVEELGGDPERILSQVGISPAQLQDPEALISATAFVESLQLAADLTQHSDFGLRLGVRQGVDVLGPLGLLARQCADAGEAFQMMSRFVGLHNSGSVVGMELQDSKAYLTYDDVTPGLPRNAQICDLALGIAMALMELFLGKEWRPDGVYFAHPRPEDISFYQAVFSAPLFFDQEIYALKFDVAALSVSVNETDPELKEYFARYVSELQLRLKSNTASTVDHLIRSLLSTGHCSEARVAKVLQMHPRTLQRKLLQEGHSFQGLLTQIRSELALSYLSASDIPLTEVATVLGYSELSAFSRFFKGHFGESPTTYRRKMRPLSTGSTQLAQKRASG
ncbi:AraC family transcriptional regulator [Aestuariicella sp. G3-2]|uniref:AraC family transcriptional regulator n=1 Tax=Pseudomaricurvus albidus TaxID=2842452 RepID=UPI001C0BB46E|nr:AraC family transcriptional regulator [Aestuariicella albida]MBU3069376.1 AraC family transcriptional regulator [Aestuariicella albida]